MASCIPCTTEMRRQRREPTERRRVHGVLVEAGEVPVPGRGTPRRPRPAGSEAPRRSRRCSSRGPPGDRRCGRTPSRPATSSRRRAPGRWPPAGRRGRGVAAAAAAGGCPSRPPGTTRSAAPRRTCRRTRASGRSECRCRRPSRPAASTPGSSAGVTEATVASRALNPAPASAWSRPPSSWACRVVDGTWSMKIALVSNQRSSSTYQRPGGTGTRPSRVRHDSIAHSMSRSDINIARSGGGSPRITTTSAASVVPVQRHPGHHPAIAAGHQLVRPHRRRPGPGRAANARSDRASRRRPACLPPSATPCSARLRCGACPATERTVPKRVPASGRWERSAPLRWVSGVR